MFVSLIFLIISETSLQYITTHMIDKQRALNNSKTVYGLYPVEKIGFDSIISICPANKLNYIITDGDSSEDDLMQFEELGVKIKICNS